MYIYVYVLFGKSKKGKGYEKRKGYKIQFSPAETSMEKRKPKREMGGGGKREMSGRVNKW